VKIRPMVAGSASLLAAVSGAALAGPTVPLGVSLGSPLGISLGTALGAVLGSALGSPLGQVLSVNGGGLLTVAAASLVAGILIVRRKKRR